MPKQFAQKLLQWRSPFWAAFLLALLSTGSGVKRAYAHGVTVDYQSTEAIEVRGMYDSGEPMTGAQVVVYAPNDAATPWLTGTTNEQGVFLFKPDPAQPGNWEVQFRQAGHGDILVIPTGGSEQSSTSLGNSSATGNSLSMVQKVLVFGAIIWGFVGTALYFSARRSPKRAVADPDLQSTTSGR